MHDWYVWALLLPLHILDLVVDGRSLRRILVAVRVAAVDTRILAAAVCMMSANSRRERYMYILISILWRVSLRWWSSIAIILLWWRPIILLWRILMLLTLTREPRHIG